MSRQIEDIDIVIPWVDGSDPEWLNDKNKYSPPSGTDATLQRYRDFGLLKYNFRGFAKFAPWVRKVHFITWGHIPEWLDTNCPKLHIVRHEDYIPKKWLPTFSVNPIELNMHRIDGLAEHFIYFNDDTYLLRPVRTKDFFREGMPVDDAVFSPVIPDMNDPIGKIAYNDMEIINKHFTKSDVVKTNIGKLLNLRYGPKLPRTLFLMPWHHLLGFFNDHLPTPFLKETFETLWDEEEELLAEVSSHRFRDYSGDVNQWLMRYWQFCKGRFVPASPKRGKDLDINSHDTINAIIKQKYSMICINDKIDTEEQFLRVRDELDQAFSSILPDKCIFEI